MATPGFTAAAALGPSRRSYSRSFRASRSDAHLLTPQQFSKDCSDDGHLCYECDDTDCVCDWFWDDDFIVTADYCG